MPLDKVPTDSWPALIVWALTKWGIGLVFLALLVPVYQDLKASNERFAKQSEVTVTVLTTMIVNQTEMKRSLEEVHDELTRFVK